MSANVQQASVLSGRSMVLAVTIALHAAVIGVLMSMRIDTGTVAQEVRLIMSMVTEELRPVEAPPPTPVPFTEHVPVVLNIAPPVVDFPVEEAVQFVAAAEQGPALVPMLPGVAESIGTGGGAGSVTPAIAPTELQFRAARSTDEYYPATSLQLGEQGATVLRVCVASTGSLQGVPAIERSSGSRRLDQAAVRWAQEALRFTPATVDGLPVDACKGFRVNFTLR